MVSNRQSALVSNRYLLRNLCAASLAGILLTTMSCGGSDSSPTGPSSGSPTTNTSLGYTFTGDPGLRVTGSNVAEPNVLSIPGATLLYLAGNGGLDSNSVYSASDGLTFAPRAASQVPGSIRSQSFVKLPDGTYRMYFTSSPSGSDLRSATSPDGLTWTQEPGTRITLNSIAVPFVTAIGGGYRVYYVVSGGPTPIGSAFSVDGLTFSPEGIRLPATSSQMWADPSVASLDGGGYLMTLSDAFSGNAPGGFARLWLATSSDGLSWNVDSQPILTDSTHSLIDPSVAVPLGGNRYRIYYASASGPVSSLGPANILSGVITKN